MNILRSHFEKIHQAREAGIETVSGLHVDIGGTLIRITTGINIPLADFLKWNKETQKFGPNILFSGDQDHANEMIADIKFDIGQVGVEGIKNKYGVYNQSFQQQCKYVRKLPTDETESLIANKNPALPFKLACVIDDGEPVREGLLKTSLVETHWDPNDPEFIELLESKAYKTFDYEEFL